jgi:DNA polymerase-3 subunit chi
MTEVGFYHLTRSALAQALPQLLARTLAAGQRALVVVPDAQAVATLSEALWASPVWLPHGTPADGDAELQPVWLSTEATPLNGARFLFLTDGAQAAALDAYERVFDLFDGNDPAATEAARNRWRLAKQAGHRLAYWQQTATGWQKKN